jgi:hypothetical protein
MEKLSKNFGAHKITVESMIEDAACYCECPYTCPCTDVTNYAALTGSTLLVGDSNVKSNMYGSIG